MEKIKLKIENYRNISFDNPIELEICPGVGFILGLNNFGKSNLLKLFFELRRIFLEGSKMKGGSNANFGTSLNNIKFDRIINRKYLNKDNRIIITITSNNKSSAIFEITSLGKITSHSDIMSKLTVDLKGGSVEEVEKERILLGEGILKLSNTLYVGPFRNAIFGNTGTYYDLSVGSNFIKQWSSWSGGENVAHQNLIENLIKELGELFNYKNFNITINDSKSSLEVTTDDGKFKLDELGGGISQFIILLGNVLIKNPEYVLIDEPEIGLHPKMQEMFVRILASKVKSGLLASSHSVGLARSAADYIYSLTKDENGKLKLGPFGSGSDVSMYQIINEMGYSQFVEIGGNNILLVEGRTDVKSFREILRKYDIENKFIILPFGGRNFITKDKSKIIDELSELKRLNAKLISVIFDSEKNSSADELSAEARCFQECCEDLGFNIFPTDFHSTENYITQESLNKIMGDGNYKALNQFENFSKAKQWPKEKNWLMFREMEKEDIDKTELGKFIGDVLSKNI